MIKRIIWYRNILGDGSTKDSRRCYTFCQLKNCVHLTFCQRKFWQIRYSNLLFKNIFSTYHKSISLILNYKINQKWNVGEWLISIHSHNLTFPEHSRCTPGTLSEVTYMVTHLNKNTVPANALHLRMITRRCLWKMTKSTQKKKSTPAHA